MSALRRLPGTFVIALVSVTPLATGCSHESAQAPAARSASATSTASAAASGSDPFAGSRGCFLLHEIGTTNTVERGGAECDERTLPASTFKIPNALIALETGVLADDKVVFRWDGEKRWIDRWNKDHALPSAMRHSVLWFFQRLAKDVGTERYREYLARFDYGNRDPSGEVTQFWLNGTLRISPREQIRFLEALYTHRLPVSKRSSDIVEKTLEFRGAAAAELRERFPFVDRIPNEVVLSGKTGSESHALADGQKEAIGWFVGSVAKDGRRWVFATRIRSHDEERTGTDAARIAHELLHEQKLP